MEGLADPDMAGGGAAQIAGEQDRAKHGRLRNNVVYFSASALRLPRPVSNYPPTILSEFIMMLMTFIIYG